MTEFFRDFDKLRKGKVTASQAQSIINQLGFQLTLEEYASLALKYQSADGMFDYSEFCGFIDSAFTQKGIEYAPTSQVKPVTSEDTLLARRKFLEASTEEQGEVDQIIVEFRKAVVNKRINLKPMFQDFDITRNGHVTKPQFIRVLSQLRIVAPDHIMHLLLKRYMDKGNTDEVNYVDFCNDVDTTEDMFGVGRDYNQSFNYYPRSQAHRVEADIVKLVPEDIEDVIARIRQRCKEERVRIGEFFRDFDKLRSGFITEAQFRIGLNMAKLVMSNNEFGLLCEHFQAPKEGKHVKWKEFSDRVDEVFTQKGLEKRVDAVVEEARTMTVYGRTKPTKAEVSVAEDVVRRFKEMLLRHRLDSKSFFQDWDRHKHFKISPKQFRQVLATFNFILTEDEIMCVVHTYGNQDNDILYMNFITDSAPYQPKELNKALSTKTTY